METNEPLYILPGDDAAFLKYLNEQIEYFNSKQETNEKYEV